MKNSSTNPALKKARYHATRTHEHLKMSYTHNHTSHVVARRSCDDDVEGVWPERCDVFLGNLSYIMQWA